MTKSHAWRRPFGAELSDSGTTQFRLWAPSVKRVELLLDESRLLAMQAEEAGWFSCDAECAAGTAYQFRLPDGATVPDPASRRQLRDVHGPSLVLDPAAYRWQHDGWRGRPWHEVVIYELHVGCFSASHDYAGVRARLQQLAELGVTAIELMPLAEFSGRRNWGYDGVLPFAPARAYGEPDELKALIDAAHGVGLCVYLDVVYNHFGPDGNYLHSYAGPFFDSDKHSPWGAAIDFARPEVRQFFTENALYWLMEYRFDGLRFDAVHAIGDPGWLDEMAARVRECVEPGRHVHLMLENERNAASHLERDLDAAGFDAPKFDAPKFDAQWNDDGHNVLHVLLTGEQEGYYRNYCEAATAKLARCLAEGFIYQGEPSPGHDGAPRGTPSGHLPPTAFILFLQNHDQVGNRALGERLAQLADARALRAAITLQLLAPHTPLLFMGEEIGTTAPFLFFTDFHDELADAVRDGRRAEFSAFAAFQSDQSRAAIPDPNAVATFQRSVIPWPDNDQLAQDGHYLFYQSLLRTRRERLAPLLPTARALGATALAEKAVDGRWQLSEPVRGGDTKVGDAATWLLRIACNLGDVAVPLAIDEAPLLAASTDDVGAAVRAGSLPPRSTAVWLSERSAGKGGA